MHRAVIFLTLFCLGTVSAEPFLWRLSPPAEIQTQLELNAWAYAEYEKADIELNHVWKQLLPKLRSKEREALIDSQLHWLKFRDADAKAAGLRYEGGSLAPFARSESRLMNTRIRTQQLQAQLQELINLGH